MTVKDPPACSRVENGVPVTFPTVEARCRACEVSGGPEEKCISEAKSADYMARTGRPCHRVLLSAANAVPASIVTWLLHSELQHLAGVYAASRLAMYSDEERGLLLDRVAFALHDEIVLRALHPPIVEG